MRSVVLVFLSMFCGSCFALSKGDVLRLKLSFKVNGVEVQGRKGELAYRCGEEYFLKETFGISQRFDLIGDQKFSNIKPDSYFSNLISDADRKSKANSAMRSMIFGKSVRAAYEKLKFESDFKIKISDAVLSQDVPEGCELVGVGYHHLESGLVVYDYKIYRRLSTYDRSVFHLLHSIEQWKYLNKFEENLSANLVEQVLTSYAQEIDGINEVKCNEKSGSAFLLSYFASKKVEVSSKLSAKERINFLFGQSAQLVFGSSEDSFNRDYGLLMRALRLRTGATISEINESELALILKDRISSVVNLSVCDLSKFLDEFLIFDPDSQSVEGKPGLKLEIR